MQPSDIRTLFDYNNWANGRILEQAATLDTATYLAPASEAGGYGSLHGVLAHIFGAEYVWRKRLQEGVSPTVSPRGADFASLAELQAAWRLEGAALRGYLSGLTDEHLRSVLQYTNTRGDPFANTLWHILAHLVNHGTQHRSEAAVILTRYGRSPGDIDLIRFLRL